MFHSCCYFFFFFGGGGCILFFSGGDIFVLWRDPSNCLSFRFLLFLFWGQLKKKTFFLHFFCLLINKRSVRLAEIRWSDCMAKSQRILCISFTRTDCGLRPLHLGSNFNLLHNSQWITFPIQSGHSIIIIIMSCRYHGYPWPSLATSPYRSLPLAGLRGYIPYPYIAAVCMFELVVLLLLGHMRGSIGVHYLWARPCFSKSVLCVWFVKLG